MTASVLAALAAAASFAWAAVYQQEAAQAAPKAASLKLRLLLDLLRSPKWIAGITLLVCGYGFQAVALAFGPVAPVQPVVVTELCRGEQLWVAWPLPRHPEIGDEPTGETELGEGHDDETRPTVGLLGRADRRSRPSKFGGLGGRALTTGGLSGRPSIGLDDVDSDIIEHDQGNVHGGQGGVERDPGGSV